MKKIGQRSIDRRRKTANFAGVQCYPWQMYHNKLERLSKIPTEKSSLCQQPKQWKTHSLNKKFTSTTSRLFTPRLPASICCSLANIGYFCTAKDRTMLACHPAQRNKHIEWKGVKTIFCSRFWVGRFTRATTSSAAFRSCTTMAFLTPWRPVTLTASARSSPGSATCLRYVQSYQTTFGSACVQCNQTLNRGGPVSAKNVGSGASAKYVSLNAKIPLLEHFVL